VPVGNVFGHSSYRSYFCYVRSNDNIPQDEDTPLHGAAGNGHIEVCNVLLAARAGVNTWNRVSSFLIQVVSVVETLRLGI
jgi:ankyrin repeat protein